ncbi:MAG TPA: orotidine-5'-phosphate decarboxylase [Dissulfurispiraceae bacterium]|nr:orotidine-5'-phosphate decarboxylase [Dissulfurispiraceae bacterium]
MPWKERLIIALDVDTAAAALSVVDRLGDDITTYKIGFELFVSAGTSVVQRIQERGKRVFLDLKYHDIPNTVARAAVAATRLGAFMFNVHASGGLDMMQRTVLAVNELCAREGLSRPRIIAVTMLTSMTNDILRNELTISHPVKTHVRTLAALAQKAGLDGVVSSPQETAMIKEQCGKEFLVVTPGIRPSWTPPDDQRRTATPQEAMRDGADFIVMGRAILTAEDPVKALELISLEMLSA